MSERQRDLTEKDKKIILSKTIKMGGSLITMTGTITIAEGLITQQGVYGSLGALICGIGVSAILAGIRQKNNLPS